MTEERDSEGVGYGERMRDPLKYSTPKNSFYPDDNEDLMKCLREKQRKGWDVDIKVREKDITVSERRRTR